ncbi:TPA: hypothetical protein ENX78_09135, partial [Candidatus Poribacteria bacterium]|nr:hypothetical protein [Candidatus Poribacteria bacterium]
MKRRSTWTIDEWILALDTYFMLKPNEIRHDNPLIIELSQTLRSLPIHGDARNDKVFRNAYGIEMQVARFLPLDRAISIVRFKESSNLQRKVWNMYSQDKGHLHEVALAIKNSLPLPFEFSHFPDVDEDNFPYGKILYQYHRYVENTSLPAKKFKEGHKRRGFLGCEICGFDFYTTYGEVRRSFIEAHHTLDITKYTKEMDVKIVDFIAVCSNCHNMLHRI